MPDNQELHIGTVSKPVFLPTTTYNVRTSYLPGGTRYELIYPEHPQHKERNVLGVDYVISRNGAQISDTRALIFGQDYEIGSPYLWLSDPTDPRCQWQVRAELGGELGTIAVIDMGYGPLPTNYNSQFYELISPGQMFFEGNYKYTLLYAEGTHGIEPKESAMTMADKGQSSLIRCTGIMLQQKFEPYSVISVNVTTSNYSVNNSPSGAAASIIWGTKTELVNGDMHGTITMTETPQV